MIAFDIEAKQFLYLNPAFEQFWDMSIKDALANPYRLLETIHPVDRYETPASVMKATKVDSPWDKPYRYRFVVQNGEVSPISIVLIEPSLCW